MLEIGESDFSNKSMWDPLLESTALTPLAPHGLMPVKLGAELIYTESIIISVKENMFKERNPPPNMFMKENIKFS